MVSKYWRLASVVLAVILVSLLLASYMWLFSRERSSGVTEKPVSLTIGLLPIIDSIPFIIADVEGLYAKYGLNVTLKFFGSARDRDAAFTTGLVDVAVNDPITTLILADKGVDVKIVSLLLGESPRDGVFYMLASPNSNVSVGEIRRVAVSRNTIIEFAAWIMLERLGLDPKRVELVDIPAIPVRFQALIEGSVEVAVLPDPWGSLALAKGARLIASDDMFGEPITMSVVVARSSIAGNTDIIRRLLGALNEALELYKANPEKYRRVVEEKIFIPEELRGKWLPTWEGRITVYPESNFNLVARWLYERGLIKAIPSYDMLVVRVY